MIHDKASVPPRTGWGSPLRDWLPWIVISLALLIPCVWQEFIEAGDLSSHVYNAWLASQIRSGSVHDLYLTHPPTNVLCDWALEWLVVRIGPAWAERVVAGIAVLLFFWGSFFFTSVVTRRRPWRVAPAFAALSYGLVFNLGFLNFYVSTGLSLWIMGLLWKPSRTRCIASLPLWVLAFAAHPMPGAWTALVLFNTHLVRRCRRAARLAILGGSIAAIMIAQLMVIKLLVHVWSPGQWSPVSILLGLTGAAQIFLFAPKYLIVAAGVMALGFFLLLRRIEEGSIFLDPVVHIWILQVTVLIFAPTSLLFPQFQHVFAYIPQRVSLFNALMACAFLGGTRIGDRVAGLAVLLAALYFTFLFVDSKAYSRLDRQVSRLVDSTPPGARVVGAIADSNSGLDNLSHLADRACIGRCFSYGNYEPATRQFRIRATEPNGVVASTMEVVKEIEQGRHIVTAEEAPIYSICERGGVLRMRRIEAGAETCLVSIPVSPSLWRDPQRIAIAP